MRQSPLRHNLARLRTFLGLGQKELAALANCKTKTVQKIELGKLELSEALAHKISAETAIAPQWLLENDTRRPLLEEGLLSGFTIEHYKARRRLRRHGFSTPHGCLITSEQGEPKTLIFYAWMRAIFAAQDGDIALRQTGKFLEDLGRRYGYDRSILQDCEMSVASLRKMEVRRNLTEIGIKLAERFGRRWRRSRPRRGKNGLLDIPTFGRKRRRRRRQAGTQSRRGRIGNKMATGGSLTR
jgi:transcriptional regulator with XRE-family HTH domain